MLNTYEYTKYEYHNTHEEKTSFFKQGEYFFPDSLDTKNKKNIQKGYVSRIKDQQGRNVRWSKAAIGSNRRPCKTKFGQDKISQSMLIYNTAQKKTI